VKSVEIDRSKHLKDEPSTGHNRFHPDIEPIVSVDEGEEVVLATRDGVDGQLGPSVSEAGIAGMDAGAVHPLTGPVFVKGARPGDVLEVEFLDILPQPHAFTAIIPGLGFLRDVFTTPFLVHWQIRDGWATSPKLPRVRIPGAPFMGVSAVAPSHAQVRAWSAREQELLGRGGFVFPPDAAGAVPSRGPAATPVMATPPRATARSASRLSKWVRPSACASACSRAPPGLAPCAGRAFRTAATLRRRSGPRLAASSPPWACPSGTTA